MTLSGEQLRALKDAVGELGIRLVELESRMDQDNDEALRSLAEARNQFNVVARIVDQN
ncbi:MAG: hypothetical protein ACLPYY_20500 [Acidimicrobiales bacterium]